MNVFVLSTDPVQAGKWHCDQHLHKMITESAQMLSLWARKSGRFSPSEHLYEVTHPLHPCTKWILADEVHGAWVIRLCEAMEEVRRNVGYKPHKSMGVIRLIKSRMTLGAFAAQPQRFVYAGPEVPWTDDVTESYKAFYRMKRDTLFKNPMTYNGRSWPEWMSK